MTALKEPSGLPVIYPIPSDASCCASCRFWSPTYDESQEHGYCLNKRGLAQRRIEGFVTKSAEGAGVISKRGAWCTLYQRGPAGQLPDSMF